MAVIPSTTVLEKASDRALLLRVALNAAYRELYRAEDRLEAEERRLGAAEARVANPRARIAEGQLTVYRWWAAEARADRDRLHAKVLDAHNAWTESTRYLEGVRGGSFEQGKASK